MTTHCKPFPLPGHKTHYAAPRPVRARHVAIELTLDFERARIEGAVTHQLTAARRIEHVTFDACELDVAGVTVDGAPARFSSDGERLTVTLPAALAAEQAFTVVVFYSAAPRRGIHFVGPDATFPQRPRQAWTQGQDEFARYWFPCLDAPQQKATSEVIAHVPASMLALSNGRLLEVAEDSAPQPGAAATRRFHFRLDVPHSPYLVTLVAGEFEESREQLGELELAYYWPKGRAEDAKRAYQNTREMVQLFERLTGERFPYPKYAQIAVSEFIFGGMENTSATTLTDHTLHDARAALDFSSDPLVSHELAHQWFGDLLTCRDWPHGWLNEGFATYFEILWKEHKEGKDEADRARAEDLELYLQEDAERYRRPIVERQFHEPIELFDRHLYEKGSLVLHELRRRLGDEGFFKGLRHYVQKHRQGAVETVDLARALEEATGQNLDQVFDQYVFHGGHPVLEAEASWDPEAKLVKVRVRQTQKTDALTPLFDLALPVRIVTKAGTREETLAVREADQTAYLRAEEEPEQLLLDPRHDALMTLSVEKPVTWWMNELAKAPEARARMTAAKHLGKDGSPRAVKALADAVLKDGFWGVQAEAAKALGAVRTKDALAALVKAVGVPHKKARRAVVKALGELRDEPEAVAALEPIARKGDASYYVESEAGRSLGRVRWPEAVPVLTAMLERPSHTDVIRQGALDGLAELKRPEGYAPAKEWTRYGKSEQARSTACNAVAALGPVADKREEARDVLEQLTTDVQFRVRMAAVGALGDLGDPKALPALRRAAERDLDGRVRRKAREVARELESGGKVQDEVHALRDDVEKLRQELRGLKERVEKAAAK